ncbi:type III secretion system needle length determinant, SpaN/EivJ family (plasmid) [Providencia alcalifaciens]|nr:type III secretion system needle length determinant, SpaN/EivJ family [Providencia alcalifaciens]
MLSPSDALVEQKLNDNWQSGNPHRWHLVQEDKRDGHQSQNQHMTDDEED